MKIKTQSTINYTDIFLLGCGAAGKGTLGRILTAVRKAHYMEMSGILGWIDRHHSHMLEAEKIACQGTGRLYSDEVVMAAFNVFADTHEVWGHDVRVYDGPGRTPGQVQQFCTLIKEQCPKAEIAVLDLRVPTVSEALLRAQKRRKAAYRDKKRPRLEDRPEVVRQRHKDFEDSRLSVLDAFREFGTVIEINATGEVRQTRRRAFDGLGWRRYAISMQVY